MAKPARRMEVAPDPHQKGAKPTDIPDAVLVNMYKQMVLIRQFDRRCVGLQRAGRIGTYPPLEGQEACQVGVGLALRPQDLLFPTYRDSGAMMLHGMPMEKMFLFWNGRVEGYSIPDNVNVFPVAVPIATQLPHAVGAGWAAKLRGTDQVALAFFGDGASSEGDFHVAMNFAGVFHTPTVFVCQNNQYAISVPYRRQTATETIAEKAAAYGFEGKRIDGCDVIEVYRTVRDALAKAAKGEGPTLVEALTYRYGAHTTSDDPTKYRAKGEEDTWRERDPIPRLAAQLRAWGLWRDELDEPYMAEVDAAISAAIAAMESAPPVDPDELFAHIYEQPTQRLLRQRDELKAALAEPASTEPTNGESGSARTGRATE